MRRPLRGFRLEAWLVLGALLVTSAPSSAGEPPVTLGEVRARTESGDFSVPLRVLLRDGIARTPFGPARAVFVLSATLVRLDSERVGHGARDRGRVIRAAARS